MKVRTDEYCCDYLFRIMVFLISDGSLMNHWIELSFTADVIVIGLQTQGI
jgi:hypothetical protein